MKLYIRNPNTARHTPGASQTLNTRKRPANAGAEH